MGNFTLFLTGFGFPDRYLEFLSLSSLIVHKRGEIWRPRTGETYKENIFKYVVPVSYDAGFEAAFDEIIDVLGSDALLAEIVASCNHVELQVSAMTNEDIRLPQIHLTSRQMTFFGRIGFDLEVNIS
jgi:hypothetical protein